MDSQVVSETQQPLSDEALVKSILAGEKNLFERLMRKYNARLYRIGMAIVHDDDAIEDLMQNAYIKAYEHLPTFEGRSGFGTWLVRILINECLQHLKRKKTQISMENDNPSYAEKGHEQTPAHAMLNKELAGALEQALLELPDKYRLVFVMREMESMSVAETKEALDLSESNVKVRLNRAKSMLRDKLHSYYKSDSVFHFYLTRCDRVVKNVFAALRQ